MVYSLLSLLGTLITHAQLLRLETDRKMKILCLHGVGGSAKQFEAQTNQITRALKEAGHEFDFVDGIMPCDSPDGMQSQ